MLVKTKTTIETEINIDFPVYVEYGTNSLYKVVSENEYIKVSNENLYNDLKTYSIEVKKGYTSAVDLAIQGRVIPQSQFDEAVTLALQHIHSIAFDKVNPTALLHTKEGTASANNVSFMGMLNEYPPIGDYRNNNVNQF